MFPPSVHDGCPTNAAADELKIPKIMQDLKDKKANKGAKAFFQVKIRGEPTPVVKW